jgi:hypothetical protein
MDKNKMGVFVWAKMNKNKIGAGIALLLALGYIWQYVFAQQPKLGCPMERHAKPGETAVESHVWWFATPEGFLTEESMTLGHHRLGVYSGVGIKIRAILNVLAARYPNHKPNEPFTVEDLLSVDNPARTRIWSGTGHVDERRLHDIMSHVAPTGSFLTTRKDFDPILEETAKNTGVATFVYGVLPVSWGAVTSGSIDEMMMLLAGGKDRKTVDTSRIYEFYTNPDKAFRRLC